MNMINLTMKLLEAHNPTIVDFGDGQKIILAVSPYDYKLVISYDNNLYIYADMIQMMQEYNGIHKQDIINNFNDYFDYFRQ